ncbi:sigma-70 family RNA polymerase sigma factor [Polyangium sp. 6x1]|uniref:sigma-70 family RNA polymerase sigma factor n=1 Tax=Polyangium sp. 6x1 TaxID=3042689 RepID=UPI0024831C04|nr:sigma-70 family RNA polymerase sigma factor [Polyangium sp. 6x1]MDI1450997.1 sigma-70 family RNA polymerase sigma factor [Polyangium sp. 6x1]
MAAADADGLAREHRRYLWGLCYRLTGSAADADDLVQETLLRAIERPPVRTDEPVRPWLTRVAVNLGIDRLRARRRRAYDGPWLPSPVETEGDFEQEIAIEPVETEGRYDLLESVSMAFLVALEALTPRQRAIVLLCDVFDWSVKEAADALEMTEPAVKTMHHRARRALSAYEASRTRRTPEHVEKTRDALGRFLLALAATDGKALESLLDAEVRHLSDGGGEFFAARLPILGRDRVSRLMMGLAKRSTGTAERFAFRMVNGMPAVVLEHAPGRKIAPRTVVQCDIGEDGAIRAIYWVLATKKLSAVGPI